jgi:hypothetical protein
MDYLMPSSVQKVTIFMDIWFKNPLKKDCKDPYNPIVVL